MHFTLLNEKDFFNRDLEIDKTPYSSYVFLLNPNDKRL